MTCNPKWEDITLPPRQQANDRPHNVARVFMAKLDALLDELLKKQVMGKVQADLHVIEWEKRGLPHAHILLIMHPDDKPRDVDHINNLVCAELPD